MTDYPALHGPSRPDWNCLVCGDPWPCLTRRRQLKELCQCNVRTLVRYMTSYLRDAHQEIGGMGTAEITERFLGWCSRPLEMWVDQERNRPVRGDQGRRQPGTGDNQKAGRYGRHG
ncbi:hypothetical protein OOK41_16790 [Micromonospora sp. NBC_01655]|uniref:hypothetical protein n=1 Tax=Micromonospora sp. NBC_01655 TaxID=2975983 RepID=UPI002258BF4B|nr:hypothetical protein [Micromonospora sp. NBC_01655]MCX4471944.1 hypothetical protein [Micromonospora sp. NBC_01655]